MKMNNKITTPAVDPVVTATIAAAVISSAASLIDTIMNRIPGGIKIGIEAMNETNTKITPRITGFRKWGGIEGIFEDVPNGVSEAEIDVFAAKQIGITQLVGAICYTVELDGVNYCDWLIGFRRSMSQLITSSVVKEYNTFQRSMWDESDKPGNFWHKYIDNKSCDYVADQGETSKGADYNYTDGKGTDFWFSTNCTAGETSIFRLRADKSLKQ